MRAAGVDPLIQIDANALAPPPILPHSLLPTAFLESQDFNGCPAAVLFPTTSDAEMRSVIEALVVCDKAEVDFASNFF